MVMYFLVVVFIVIRMVFKGKGRNMVFVVLGFVWDIGYFVGFVLSGVLI